MNSPTNAASNCRSPATATRPARHYCIEPSRGDLGVGYRASRLARDPIRPVQVVAACVAGGSARRADCARSPNATVPARLGCYCCGMAEKDFYPRVAQWAAKSLGCFHTAIDAGLKRGRIDVVGLRDVGGNLSGRSEVVSIEVKHGKQPFATSIGQVNRPGFPGGSGYWFPTSCWSGLAAS